MDLPLGRFISNTLGFLIAWSCWGTGFLQAQVQILDTVFLAKGEVVYFDFGSAMLPASSDSVLDNSIAWFMSADSPVSILITGHTDAVGSDNSNQRLSVERSKTVYQKLVSSGIPDSLIQLQNYGERAPVGSNSTDLGRSYNRRVTIDFFQSGKAFLIKGQLIDESTRKGISGEIVTSMKGFRDTLQADSSGYFTFFGPLKGILSLQGYALKHYFKGIVLNPSLQLPDSLIQIALPPIETGEIIDVENLYFISNTPVLIDRSKPELDKLVHFMEYNPDVSIEIAGHVNFPGKNRVSERSWYYELSVLRAKMVYNHLVSNGISAFRMRYKGYGNWQMRFRNPSNAEESQLNRRVEIRILNDGTLK